MTNDFVQSKLRGLKLNSEFADYANSILYVPIASGKTEQDEWGNVRPVAEIVEVFAFLKESRKEPKQRPQPGVDTAEVYVKGYLVNPMRWPNNIRPRECEVFTYGKRGKLQVLSQLPRPFNTEEETGDVVEGWVRFQI